MAKASTEGLIAATATAEPAACSTLLANVKLVLEKSAETPDASVTRAAT